MIEDGRQIFRYDTFGSEAFWGDALQLHKAIAGSKSGGIGDGVSPKTALAHYTQVTEEHFKRAAKRCEKRFRRKPQRGRRLSVSSAKRLRRRTVRRSWSRFAAA